MTKTSTHPIRSAAPSVGSPQPLDRPTTLTAGTSGLADEEAHVLGDLPGPRSAELLAR